MADVTKIFEDIKFNLRPEKETPLFELMFESFFKSPEESNIRKNNFIGGMNDRKNTLHENLFQAMFPDLKSQVTFGTGKGGYEKYLSKKFTADFYDKENKVIFEIDGKSHTTELGVLKNKIRDYFFWHELGLRTIRITNERVEEMLMEHLKELNESGDLDEILKR